MTAFKKSDSNQIEMVMAGIIGIMLILIPLTFMLEWFGVIPYGWSSSAEIIVTVGGGILLIFLIMYIMKPENRYLCLLDVFLLLEMLSLILSTIFAEDPNLAVVGNDFSMEGTIINIVYLLLIFCCANLKNKKHRMFVYGSLILVALFETFMGFMQTVVRYGLLLGDADWMESMGYRAYGTLMNQNPYGALMAIFAALEFGLLITCKGKVMTAIHSVLTVLFTCCVMFSGTRGAMVGLGFAIIFYGIIIFVCKCKKKENVKGVGKKYLLAILVAVVAIVIASLLSTETLQSTVDRVSSDTSAATTSTSVDALGSGRLGLWKQVIDEWLNSNVLTGVGVANLKLYSFVGGTTIFDSVFSVADVAHNEFLDILVTRGIIGLVTYLALMLYVFIFAMKKLFKKGIRNSKDLFGLLLAFVTYMATAFFGWRIIYLTPYFYVMVGLTVSRDESKKLKLKKNWKRK